MHDTCPPYAHRHATQAEYHLGFGVSKQYAAIHSLTGSQLTASITSLSMGCCVADDDGSVHDGQIVPCDDDDDDSITHLSGSADAVTDQPCQQLPPPHSNSAIVVKSEPLLIKSEPGSPSVQHPQAPLHPQTPLNPQAPLRPQVPLHSEASLHPQAPLHTQAADTATEQGSALGSRGKAAGVMPATSLASPTVSTLTAPRSTKHKRPREESQAVPSPSQQRTDRPLPASRLPHMPTLPQAQTPMQPASPQLQGVTPPQQPPRPPVYHSQLQAQPHSLSKAPTASTGQARVSLQFPNLHRQATSGSLRLTSHEGLQQTAATTLQLASLPEAHPQAAGAPQDTSCHQKALEKILRNFGPNAGLEAAAMYQALEALVFHLTDPAYAISAAFVVAQVA